MNIKTDEQVKADFEQELAALMQLVRQSVPQPAISSAPQRAWAN